MLSHGTVVCSLCTVSGRSGPQWAGHFGQPVISEDGVSTFLETPRMNMLHSHLGIRCPSGWEYSAGTGWGGILGGTCYVCQSEL